MEQLAREAVKRAEVEAEHGLAPGSISPDNSAISKVKSRSDMEEEPDSKEEEKEVGEGKGKDE